MNFFSPVEVSHRFVQTVGECESCVDATVGNGYDTLFLAEKVGETGKVLGFDVQEAAITQTQVRLKEGKLDKRVILKNGGHEDLHSSLQSLGWESLNLAMFNLGYLPGSDKSIITRTDSTMAALEVCLKYLVMGGAISVVAYRGHSGASEEYDAVQNWVTQLAADDYFSLRFERWSGQRGAAPVFFWIRRRG